MPPPQAAPPPASPTTPPPAVAQCPRPRPPSHNTPPPAHDDCSTATSQATGAPKHPPTRPSSTTPTHSDHPAPSVQPPFPDPPRHRIAPRATLSESHDARLCPAPTQHPTDPRRGPLPPGPPTGTPKSLHPMPPTPPTPGGAAARAAFVVPKTRIHPTPLLIPSWQVRPQRHTPRHAPTGTPCARRQPRQPPRTTSRPAAGATPERTLRSHASPPPAPRRAACPSLRRRSHTLRNASPGQLPSGRDAPCALRHTALQSAPQAERREPSAHSAYPEGRPGRTLRAVPRRSRPPPPASDKPSTPLRVPTSTDGRPTP
ncbi:unnamed protein product [Dicrocoelium dendriticum]|nr:unnamed protein product [Dicrocoelium dendriticum]